MAKLKAPQHVPLFSLNRKRNKMTGEVAGKVTEAGNLAVWHFRRLEVVREPLRSEEEQGYMTWMWEVDVYKHEKNTEVTFKCDPVEWTRKPMCTSTTNSECYFEGVDKYDFWAAQCPMS